MIKKRIQSFSYAIKGIFSALHSEANMRIHIFMMCAVIFTGALLDISLHEWIACLICFGMVITAEMFNTAIECIVDLVSPNTHPLAGRAKDIAAGAVLVTAIMAAGVGICIFLPKVLALF